MSRTSKSKRDAKKKARNRSKAMKNGHSKRSSCGPVLTTMDHPLSHLTDEQRKELSLKLGKAGKEKVVELLDFFNIFLRKYNPITLLAILSGYGLTSGASDEGVQLGDSSGKRVLHQAHIELIQAFTMQIPEDELGFELVTPDIVQEAWEKLIEISDAFNFSRINDELLTLPKNDQAISKIQEMIRSNTQMVRNWGFFAQTVNISKELYGHFDEILLAEVGFSVTNAIDTFKIMTKTIEERLTKRLKDLAGLRATRKSYDLLAKYHDLIGQGKEEADEVASLIDVDNISHKELFIQVLSHYDLRLSDNYFFNSADVAQQVNLDKETIDKIFNYFSYSFGDLAHHKKEFFFLENPVWRKPIISSKKGFFCPMPQLFFSFIFNILDEVVEAFDKDGLHKRRAEYLEAKIEEIVKRRFPESKTVVGIKWYLDDVQYETDLITFIDSHAIIVEAKSQKISRPALRGAPDRIKKHLEEILINPGLQSSRLEEKLNTLRLQKSPGDPLIKKLPVDIDKIKKVLRVSVSLEDFAALQAKLSLFHDTGWIPSDFIPCPSINLADFETLFDFFEHPVQIVHYIQRRTELEGVIKFLGDELDFMGLYITTLLNLGNMPLDDTGEIIITGMSRPLDKYYLSRDQEIFINKPQPKISPLFKKIFNKLEERATPRWTEIGCILNYFPPDDQLKLTNYIKKLSKEVSKRWQVEGHKNIIIYSPPESSKYALAVVLFKNENSNRRYEFIEQAFALGAEPEHVKYCLVIAINIDRNDLPYHYIALAEAKG